MSEAGVRQWLERTAWPLAGVEPGASTADLEPLKGVLEGVRLVGLGESTHGTREFFQLKHRLLEYLVTELGYGVLAIEASESAAPAVDAYVRGGPGDAATVVSDLGFWTWRTEEVVAMVEWMRSYNEGRPAEQQVGFAGIDPQKCAASLEVVRGHLAATAPERLELFDTGIAAEVDAGPGAKPDPARTLVRETEALAGYLAKHDAPDVVLAAARRLVRAAEVVCTTRQHKDPAKTTFAIRDRLMADAVSEVAGDNTKVVLWATTATSRPVGGLLVCGRSASTCATGTDRRTTRSRCSADPARSGHGGCCPGRGRGRWTDR